MVGTKFFVLRMKDLIKVGAIAIGALVVLIFALVFLLGGGDGDGQPTAPGAVVFNPGTYTSTIVLNNKPIEIQVGVDYHEILYVTMTDMADIQRVFYPLFEPRLEDLAREVLLRQSAYITPATDYPVTTNILHQAVKAALGQAILEPDWEYYPHPIFD